MQPTTPAPAETIAPKSSALEVFEIYRSVAKGTHPALRAARVPMPVPVRL